MFMPYSPKKSRDYMETKENGSDTYSAEGTIKDICFLSKIM